MGLRIAGFLGCAALLLGGCTSGRAGEDLGTPDVPLGDVSPRVCSGCHGGPENAAPPVDTKGSSETTQVTVGAHQSHLKATLGLSAPVPCTTCHVVPSKVDEPGHLDGQVRLRFTGVAVADGAAPTFDPGAATCAGSYCHGATLSGGTLTAPKWTTVDGTQAKCGSCHGAPPPAPHPQNPDCSSCHGDVVNADRSFKDVTRHINGTVDVSGIGNCNSCHGNADNSAPPVDTNGGSDTTLVSVGAHQTHLKATGSKPVQCSACHTVPTAVGDPGHMDDTAEVAFKGLSVNDGATPSWNATAATCAGSYCHGATLGGGGNKVPKWTTVDGTQAACGTCHGGPPPAPHPQNAACSACHGDVINADGSFKDVSRHVDGTVDVSSVVACNSCHGSPDNNAPPLDTNGGSDTAQVSVGAHQTHLKATLGLSAPVPCTTCHAVPSTVDDPGHIDGQAALQFTGTAVADGATPTWDRGAATCAGSYCHGATLGGGGNKVPKWTTVDGTQAACGTCHGGPPPAPHPQNPDCSACHGDVINADGSFKDVSRHVDGTVDVSSVVACNSCHGSPDNNAPPLDTNGGSDTAQVSVGAHQTHLKATLGLSAPMTCETCHAVPSAVDDPGHIDGQAALQFTGTAVADGATPTWDRGAATCAGSYCHGATLGGGGNKVPKWTTVDGTQAACGTCHGGPPPAPHPQNAACSACHGDVINADGSFKDVSRHVDGTVDVSSVVACNSCHGSPDNNAPPLDTNGGSDTAQVSVGAHQTHLKAPLGLSAPMTCETCHAVPSAVDDPGHIDGQAALQFTGTAVADGATPTWDRGAATCAGSYCHGATLGGGGNKVPKWTTVDGTQAACGTCHAVPPPAPHPVTNLECSVCHGMTVGPGNTILHPDKHVNGTVDVADTTNCSSCHGSLVNPAPPVDLAGSSDTSRVTVGAHQNHLQALSGLSLPVPCVSCHVRPQAFGDPGHVDSIGPAELTFSGLARTDGADPTWNRGTATCANAYCHGATLSGGLVDAPVWTDQDGSQLQCSSCHGAPPPAPHPAQSNCSLCHGETAGWDGSKAIIANPAKHIDGNVDYQPSGACNACHGNAENFAPPLDTTGRSDTSLVTVGAHQSHLLATLSRPVDCDECHLVPASVDDPAHIDGPTATLTFGDLSKTGAAEPSWDRSTETCTNAYCHGSTLSGGTNKAPTWTTVDGSQSACGTCHGNPPPLPHPQSPMCGTCHAPTAALDGTIADPTRHIDGVVDTRTGFACNSCHGSATNNAPPVDLSGSSSTARVTVGAHQAHLVGTSNLAVPLVCTDCHKVPGSLTEAGHIDSLAPAELTFGTTAKLDGANPSWSRATARCSGTYCHGTTLPAGGAANRTPTWNVVNNTQDACGTCHGISPTTGRHPSVFGDHSGFRCTTCHGTTTTNTATPAINDKTRHINGQIEVQLTNGTWNASARSCAPVCHDPEDW